MNQFFTPEEQQDLKAFMGTPHQAFLVRAYRRRIAEFFRLFMDCPDSELVQVRAQAAAYHRILSEISLDQDELSRLDTDVVQEMEEQRKVISKALERSQQEARDRMSRATLGTL